MALAASWLNFTVSLVKRALSQVPPQHSSYRELAAVEPCPPPGWYLVQGRVSAHQLDFISEGNLTYGSGDHALAFDVLEVAVDDEQVRVRASEAAPREKLSLCVRSTGIRQILDGLVRGLEASQANPLLAQFGERQLTPIQFDPRLAEAPGWPGLRPAQRGAVAACCSAGLQLVWGPPGTGKTHVIATAVSHLVGSGQRVLLVSSTNIAVDTALQEALHILPSGGQGQAVRVGRIDLPELMADSRIRLDRLVELRQTEQQARVDSLARQLEELANAGARLAEAEKQLTGFDADSYRLAAERVSNRHRYDQVIAALGQAEARLVQVRAELHLCERQVLSLASCEAADAEIEIRRDLAAVEAALAIHRESSLMTRARRPGLKSKLTANRANLANELARATTARRAAETAARQAGADPVPPIRPDPTQTAIAAERARRGFTKAAEELRKLQDETDRLTRAGLAEPVDESLVTAEHQRWALHKNLPDLRRHLQDAQRQRVNVQKRYEEATERLHREKRAIEREIISSARLVATTLTQLALRSWLTQTRFDHVIVDEAAAAQLPHIVHAVGYAGTGAVLVGDYLQNGPIVDAAFPGGPQVKDLFKTNCFSFFDATDPRKAQRSGGCVVLTEQFRFGPALTELANHVAYRGILSTAGRGDSDIIVVTVDGLPQDIRDIHRGQAKQAGWWLIGALMARALAEQHYDAGARNAFGIVVPYRAQVDATQSALDDSALARATPVGTAHKFQGRQFDTVLADLVEDGNGRMSKADLHGNEYDIDSVRIFNVAATRPRSRLYVLVSRRALERASNGPLAVLRSIVSTGRAHRVDADSLLGMFDGNPPPPGTPEADLMEALDPYVRVAGIHDEDAAIDEVVARIGDARSSVWCWSAWVGRHAEGIIDALYRAQRRGVAVHVMARPEREVQGANRESLRRLVARMPRVVFIQSMHQKIVVVDGQWSIVGSMNMLSHGEASSRRIRDVMVTMDGARFAERLLSQELAGELGQLRDCPVCGQALAECGLVGSGRDRDWAWICTADRGHRRPFPHTGSRTASRRNESRRS